MRGGANDIAADDFAAVARATHLTGLRELLFRRLQTVVTDRAADELLANPALAGLETLFLIAQYRANVHLSPAAEGRLRDRFGDGYQLNYLEP